MIGEIRSSAFSKRLTSQQSPLDKLSSVMRVVVLVFVAVMAATASSANRTNPFRDMFPHSNPYARNTGVNPGKPLFLTPYLEKGQIEEARRLSQTGSFIPVKGYSGYITVNKTVNSNMFFWFFPAQDADPETAPVVLWLQGGPGGSSLFGLFAENGPVAADKDGNILRRNITWNSKYSMLYIDNPVGTGFSFTGEDAGYATNEVDVARDLYSCLTQFFQIFVEYQKNDFYVTGESYGGKYCPAISYKIHQENPTAKLKINLKGVAIGDGFSDPETMMPVFGDYMFYIGLVDENQRDKITSVGKLAAQYCQSKQFLKASKAFDDISEMYRMYSGLNQMYNYLLTKGPIDEGYYSKLIERPEARFALHVGNMTFNDGNKVGEKLAADFMDTVKPWLAEVMDNYKVMLYNGQLDVIVANPLTEAMILTIPWKGQETYRNAERVIWKVQPTDVEVAGYVRQAGNFFQVTVRNAGHILPHDQPRAAQDMIQRFIEDRPFN